MNVRCHILPICPILYFICKTEKKLSINNYLTKISTISQCYYQQILDSWMIKSLKYFKRSTQKLWDPLIINYEFHSALFEKCLPNWVWIKFAHQHHTQYYMWESLTCRIQKSESESRLILYSQVPCFLRFWNIKLIKQFCSGARDNSNIALKSLHLPGQFTECEDCYTRH